MGGARAARGGGGEVQVGSWMSLGLWKISDWIKYHRVVKINQVSDLRLEAAQGNKIDFTGFVQNVELCYKKVDTKAKDGVFSLLRVPICPESHGLATL